MPSTLQPRRGTSRIEEPRAARGRQVARHTVASNGTTDRSKLAASHPPIKLLSELTFAGYESSRVTRRVLSF